MANLDLRFDKYTEKYQSDELERIRQFADAAALPAAVSLEIGTNRGRFLTALAQRRPDHYFLGVEWSSLAKQARGRLERADVDNARVLAADANLAIPVIFDDEQLAEIFLMFPDPWWKTRHRKRRVIGPEFLDVVAPKLAPGGTIWIRTDVGPFAEDMRQILADHPDFEPVDLFGGPLAPLPRSTRERHVIGSGLPVHRVYFKRSKGDVETV